ncbi:hypothetical protein BC629DRAFT_1727656 [Irpex lacteus]|nr:hypothetical protein BC629DRAFT_1727656 [Irpex lacteus]
MAKPKNCPHCSETFSKNKSLNNHMKSKGHGWTCSTCKSNCGPWAKVKGLNKHRRNFHGNKAVKPLPATVAASAPCTGYTGPQAVYNALWPNALRPNPLPSITALPNPYYATGTTEPLTETRSLCETCGLPCLTARVVQDCSGNYRLSYLCATCERLAGERHNISNLPREKMGETPHMDIVCTAGPAVAAPQRINTTPRINYTIGIPGGSGSTVSEQAETSSTDVAEQSELTSTPAEEQTSDPCDSTCQAEVATSVTVLPPSGCTKTPLEELTHLDNPNLPRVFLDFNIVGQGITLDDNDDSVSSTPPSPYTQLVPATEANNWDMVSNTSEGTDIALLVDCDDLSDIENEQGATDYLVIPEAQQSPPLRHICEDSRSEASVAPSSPTVSTIEPANGAHAKEDSTSFEQQASSPPPTSSRFSCRVCLCDPKQPVTTLCGHLFCHGCIIGELSKNLSCPVCQTAMLIRLNLD